jgi:hypothetical protein
VGAAAGYALLVQGRVPGNEGLETHNRTMNRVYEVLKARGFTDSSIYYYNNDTNQDGFIDTVGGGPQATVNPNTGNVIEVDEVPEKNAIQTLLTDPASQLVIDMQAVSAPLYIVFTDHGKSTMATEGEFFVTTQIDGTGATVNETISSTDLADWITQFEALVSNPDPIISVIGTCYAGSWLEDLRGDNRINIFSAAAGEESYRGYKEPVDPALDPTVGPTGTQFLRTGEIFVEEFFKAAEQGVSLKGAFEIATRVTEEYTRIDDSSFAVAPYEDNAAQHPWMDDNGFNDLDPNDRSTNNKLADPVGSNPKPDGLLADAQFLGVGPGIGFNPSATGVVADVVSVNETVFLSDAAGDNDPLLFLKANSDGLVSAAWIEVRQLNIGLPPASGGVDGVATVQRANDVGGAAVREILARQPGIGYTEKQPLFGTAGTYRVFYYVQDVATGNISPTVFSTVYKDTSANSFPTFPTASAADPLFPELNLPADGGTAETSLLFDWDDAVDPDITDALTYTLEVATALDGSGGLDPVSVVLKREGLVRSFTYIDASGGLLDATTYYWQVTAIDQFGKRVSSIVSQFETDNTNGVRGVVFPTVTNGLSDVLLSGAVITATKTVNKGTPQEAEVVVAATEAAYLGGGTFYRKYPPDVYSSITIDNVSGFDPAVETNVDVSADQAEYQVQLQTAVLDSDGDGIEDSVETANGTNPYSVDTDQDGIVDGGGGTVRVVDYPTGGGYPVPVDTDGDDYVDGEQDFGNDPTKNDFADGNIAPYNNPDMTLNTADYLVATRIVLDELPVTPEALGHIDMNADGAINAGDLVLLMQAIQSQ